LIEFNHEDSDFYFNKLPSRCKKMHSSGGLHHHQLHSSGQQLLIQLPAGVDGAQATTYVLDAAGNVTLGGPTGSILTVDGHLVQGHAEVHLTDERGNVQQVAYATYTNSEVFLWFYFNHDLFL